MDGKPCAFLRPSIEVDKKSSFFASFSKLLLNAPPRLFKLSLPETQNKDKQDDIHGGEK